VPAALNVSNIEHGTVSTLLRLKAIILGLDWEITDEYLTNLKLEVADLQEHFSGNESCLDLLGGIGEVGEYIKEKKAEAHSEAFKVLHLLFEGLEHLLSVSVSPAEARSSVFPLLEKLQAFRMMREDEKTQVSDALPAGGPVTSLSGGEEIAPAFSSLDEKEVHGFWAEEEEGASALMDDADVGDVVDSFFGENETVGFEPAALTEEIEKIPGLDVEEDDAAESVAALSSQGDEPAPALSFEEEESELSETSSFAGDTEMEVAAALGLDDGEEERPDFSVTSENQAAAALEGVNVEEDDDDDDDLMMPGVAESIAFASDISETPEEDETPLQAYSPAGDGGIESDQVSEVAEGDVEAAEREVAAALGLDDGEEERPDFSVTSENQVAAALEGVNVEEDDDDDDDFVMPDIAESIAFTSDISETPEEEDAVPLKSLSPSDVAPATAGTVESIAAVGGLAGSAVMSDFAAGGEDADEIKESLDGFFGRDEEILSVPVEADSASDSPVVFLPAENDEEQDSVQNLRMHSEEFVQGGTGASIEEVLSERDRLQGLMQGRPIELNLLQLFSTVADSLGRGDKPTDAESIALLRSTSQALAEVLADANIVRDLEALRVETGKVLKWLSSRRV
jgi:pilus assembly protein FimV